MNKPLLSQSFFVFGAKGVGKSTFLKEQFLVDLPHFFINLLDTQTEDLYRVQPHTLTQVIDQILKQPHGRDTWIVIDEVQKLPRLLDLVHLEIESRKIKFVLTGNSTRKLKQGGANMLAGRAFVNEMYPLTTRELGPEFDLDTRLRWGSLPKIFELDLESRTEFLMSYVLTYLKEEVVAEQLVRNIDPFRSFLSVAAQNSGTIVNFSKVAKHVHSDPVSVRNYFDILIDTYLGFELPVF